MAPVENSLNWPLDKPKDMDWKGDLTVSGKSYVQLYCIERPLIAYAWFSDKEPSRVGCGPKHPDELEVEIVKSHSWYIIVKWHIRSGGTRNITWEATLAKGWWRTFLGWLGWF